MTDTIQSILDDVETAAESDDYEALRRLLDELDEAYTERERVDRARVERARLAREEYERGSDESARLSEHIEQGISIELARAGVLGTFALYAADPTQTDASQLVETISSTASEEQSFDDGASAVEPAIADVSLPPQLLLAGVDRPEPPYLKGNTVAVSAFLENVGDATATGLATTVSGRGLDVDRTSPDVGSLAGDAGAELAVAVTATDAGSYTLRFEVDSENAGTASQTVDLEVEDKASLVETLRTELDDLQSRVEDSISQRGIATALQSKLSNADEQFERAAGFVDDGRTRQANDALTAGTNVLGAFLNQVDAADNDRTSGKGGGNGSGKGGQLSPATVAALTARATNLVEVATDARSAAI